MTVSSAGCMTMGTACDLKSNAIALIQRGDGMASSSTTKSADAWQGFYTALMSLKSCSHPSCGTPSTAMTEASLSEIGSSHGSSSPRKFGGDIEMEDDASDTDMSDMDPAEEDSDLVPSPSSKRGRRRNRRRRTRGGRRSAARRARLRDAAACDTIDEELAPASGVASLPSSRDVVLLSDLGLLSPSVTGGCAAESKMPAMPADSRGAPCYSTVGAHANTNAGPGHPASTGSDASARIPAPQSMSNASQEAVFPACCGIPRPQANICAGLSSTWIPGTPAAPNGPCAILLISPCHAWSAPAGSIVSTSPMTTAQGGPAPNVAMAGAGSRSADTFRSWLQASGLPPAADIVAQLQAAAPEFYED
mmetsp:Transcript_157878/g.274069  ORF Transcript_157878/g.274069 Transcript_157878/m.274069 type:complete len:363 (-) Transcript_157878:81-1169(-)